MKVANDFIHLYQEDILICLGNNDDNSIHHLAFTICQNSKHYDDDYNRVYGIMNNCRKMLFPNGQNYDHSQVQSVKRMIRPFCIKGISEKELMRSYNGTSK